MHQKIWMHTISRCRLCIIVPIPCMIVIRGNIFLIILIVLVLFWFILLSRVYKRFGYVCTTIPKMRNSTLQVYMWHIGHDNSRLLYPLEAVLACSLSCYRCMPPACTSCSGNIFIPLNSIDSRVLASRRVLLFFSCIEIKKKIQKKMRHPYDIIYCDILLRYHMSYALEQKLQTYDIIYMIS